MKQTLDMRFIRYLNLFEKITGVRARNCFLYNNCMVFAVPSSLVSKAIGSEGKNVKKLSVIVRKKIKVVALPEQEEIEKFVSEIIKPSTIKAIEVGEKEIIITADKHNKAGLIGRNKVRLIELKKIIEEFFGKELRII